jgi:hypothetical protein
MFAIQVLERSTKLFGIPALNPSVLQVGLLVAIVVLAFLANELLRRSTEPILDRLLPGRASPLWLTIIVIIVAIGILVCLQRGMR